MIKHPHPFSRRARRATAVAVSLATAVVTLGALTPSASGDTGSTPDFLSTFGGSGRAETYPSGLETTPDGGVVLADTGNDRVEKYDANGNLVWIHGTHGFGAGGINNPRDIGVDAQGNVYVADTGNTSIVKLTASGQYVGRYRGPAGDQIQSPIGVTVANGEIIVADAGALKIRIFSLDGTQRRTITQPATGCTFAAFRDVTADAQGNYYVANYTRNNILKLSPTGACLGSFGSNGTGDGQFKNPYGVAVAQDPTLGDELVYVADSNNNRIQVFHTDGRFVGVVGAQGGFGTPGTFSHLRRVAVAADGDIWGADLWGFTAQRFNRTATGWSYAQTIGTTGPGRTETKLLNQPNGIDSDAAGNIYVSDRMHHRYVVFNRQGELLRICGDRGSTDLGFNWPADLAVDESTGEVWVADTHQNQLKVVDPGCAGATVVGGAGAALGQFRFPSGIEIRNSDRIAFVADTNNKRLVSYNVATRQPIASAALGLGNPQGVAVDPVSGDVFVADKSNNRVLRVASANGSSFSVVRTYPGLNKPEGVSLDGAGRLYVADTLANRVVVLNAATGAEIGTITNPDGFDEPQNLSFSDGVLYVSDTFRDRVQSYAWGGDPVAPLARLTAPAANDSLPSATVALRGAARDNARLAGVEVSVQDTGTSRWWNPATSGWTAQETWYAASLATPTQRGSDWSASFDEPAAPGSGSYRASVRATDQTGNLGAATSVTFTVNPGTPPVDTAAPDTSVTFPATNGTTVASPVDLVGQATDNVGVDRVDIAVRDRTTLQWWNPVSSTWQGSLVRFDADLTGRGATTADWSYRFAPVGGSNSYNVQARAWDAAGNKDDTSPAQRNFLVDTTRRLTYVRDFAGPGLADMTPVDVAVSPTHYYALDVARYRIVRVNRASGQIDASVGGGRGSAPGELAAARSIARAANGDVFIADTPNNRVSVYDADLAFKFSFGTSGTGAQQFTQVYGLAIGQGVGVGGQQQEIVYTIDGDGRIKRWSTNGVYIGDFATGTTLNQPRMAEVHPVTRDLWVVNARDRQVVVFTSAGAERFRFGRGGTGDGQFMGDPRGLAISADGTRAYVSDEGNHRIQVFDEAGAFVQAISRTPGASHYLVDVRGIDVTAQGTLVASDEWDFSLKEFNAATGGDARKLFGAAPPKGGVNTPRGLDIDSQGRVFVSDWWNQRIHYWSSNGTFDAFGQRGTTADPGSINFAWDIALQPGTDRVFVANRESHEIEIFTRNGGFVDRWGVRGTAPGQFTFPQGLDFAPNGDLVVADSANNRLQRFTLDTTNRLRPTAVQVYGGLGTAAGRFGYPTGVSVAPDGTIWVADTDNNRIQKRNPTTGAWTAYAQPDGGTLTYRRPWGVTANGDGTVWVTDSGRGRVVLIGANGAEQLSATGQQMGAGELAQPFDTLVLPNGNLLISDSFNNRIVEVSR